MQRTCTKPTCAAQESRPRSCAECAKPKQARPSDPLDFRRAAFEEVGYDPALAEGLTGAEFRALYSLAKRVRDAERPKGLSR